MKNLIFKVLNWYYPNSDNFIRETFIEQQYLWLSKRAPENSMIVDIGANVGDSSIYFAQNDNIKKVLAYEKDLEAYARGKILLGLCPLKYKIKYNKLDVNHNNFNALMSRLISSYPILLKMDVEGAEHDIIKADTDLEQVLKLQIEYHYGPQVIPKILKAKGFKIKVQPTGHDKHCGDVGWIYGYR